MRRARQALRLRPSSRIASAWYQPSQKSILGNSIGRATREARSTTALPPARVPVEEARIGAAIFLGTKAKISAEFRGELEVMIQRLQKLLGLHAPDVL
jgi:hypothetical protein